jgi:sialate O-acetylesterase
MITLKLGRIDDVDAVYVNGNLVGSSGTFPPHYETAYWAWREYPLPVNLLNFDKENVIAVRVYDSQLGGGIIEGEVGLFELEGAMRLDYNLAGEWKFNIGDDMKWKEPNYDDRKWEKIRVPASWDVQGYKDYDGFAWYRTTIKVPSYLAGKKLVLSLGKIDDIDEAYIDGKLVGSTGDMNDGDPVEYNQYNEYQQSRGYYIPNGLIEPDKEIVIAVRVYDGYNIGGIYEGPVGLIEHSKYIKYWREQRDDYKWKNKSKARDIWDWIFNND